MNTTNGDGEQADGGGNGSARDERLNAMGCEEKRSVRQYRARVMPGGLSATVLAGMDRTMRNFRLGKASSPVDLSGF